MSRKSVTCTFAGVAFPVLARLAASVGSAALAWLLASCLGAQTYQVLHSFGGPDGASPSAAVIADAWGNLYGTTHGGGAYGYGTVFRLDAANNYALTTLHDFDGSDGRFPDAALIADASGSLYGTTYGQFSTDLGTVFKLDAANNYALATLHAFAGSDGAHPSAALIADASGNLYGTTASMGLRGHGTVFKLDAANDYALTTLHAFAGPDGDSPRAAVIADASGNLFGTTAGGGSYYRGTVFRLDSAHDYALTVLHSFDASDEFPLGGLIADAAGNLYGTTAGEWYSYGTVFKLDAANNYALTTLYAFSGPDGTSPWAGLIADASGNLYGTTHGVNYDETGPEYWGTVFELEAAQGYALTTLHDFFEFGVSADVRAAVVADASGDLFGTTASGGYGGAGAVFSLSTGVPVPATGIAPSSGPSEAGTTITVTGTGFSPTASIRIGGALATAVTVVSATELTALTPPLPPGRLNSIAVTNAAEGASAPGVLFAVPDVLSVTFLSNFVDVPQDDIFHADVEKVFRNGITAGCGGGAYCRDNPITRAQTSVFLLKAEHGSDYAPPVCSGIFGDVPCSDQYAPWIERLSAEGITAGCSGGNYCPGDSVTRAQTAVLLLKTEHGSSYMPPACAGLFPDVPCIPTPAFAVDWIERLYDEGVTGGCGGGNYCPATPVTRGQMAAFLVRTFDLP